VPSFADDPAHWRKRAKEARTLADQMNDAQSKQTMMRIAEDYEGQAALIGCAAVAQWLIDAALFGHSRRQLLANAAIATDQVRGTACLSAFDLCGATGSRIAVQQLLGLQGVRRSKDRPPMSELGQSRRYRAGSSFARCPLHLQKRTFANTALF
jgi:hypothetical protein